MTSHHQHSEACCNVPPVIATKGYKFQGGFENISRMKTYVTGPSLATSGILVIYDTFGYTPQTLQGADILAAYDQEHQYRVFVPDILEDNFANIEWRVAPDTFAVPIQLYPPTTPEKKSQLYPYLEGHANPDRNSMKVPGILHVLRKNNPEIKSWGIVGYCWGGKMASINARDPTLFTAAAQCHPAFVNECDASSVRIPMCVLASGDEDASEIQKYAECLKGEKRIETFSDMTHGWMSARGDLEDEGKRAGYERAYQMLLEFFAKYLYGKGERTMAEIYANPNDPFTLGCEE